MTSERARCGYLLATCYFLLTPLYSSFSLTRSADCDECVLFFEWSVARVMHMAADVASEVSYCCCCSVCRRLAEGSGMPRPSAALTPSGRAAAGAIENSWPRGAEGTCGSHAACV